MPEEASRPFVNHWNHSDHTRYDPSESRLHWYVLPPEHVVSFAVDIQRLVEDPLLRPIPGPWLHCTVIQLLPIHEVSHEQQQELLIAGQESIRDLSPFHVDGFAVAGGQGATWLLEPQDEIEELHRRIVEASQPYLSAPKPMRYTPHITTAYSHGEGDSSPVVANLRSAPRLPFFMVDRVFLLDVTREPGPAKGWYSWKVIGEAVLNGGSA
jgi:2'-5' RNA ligase